MQSPEHNADTVESNLHETRAALAKVAAVDLASVDLLGLLAHLAPEPVELEWLIAGATALPERLRDALSKQGALAIAQPAIDAILVARENASLRMAAPTQNALREVMSSGARAGWTRVSIKWLSALFPIQLKYEDTIPLCDSLVPHALAAAVHAEAIGAALESTGALLNHVGLYLHGCDRSDEAIPCLRRAIAFGEKAPGPNATAVAIRCNNLGVVHQSVDSAAEAIPYFERAVSILRSISGPTDESLAQPLRNLYTSQIAAGRWAEARDACEAAGPVFAAHLAFDDPLIAERENALGIACSKLGDHVMARKCFDRALLSASNTQRVNPATVAAYRTNYGSMLLDSGEYDDAMAEFRAALESDRSMFQGNHLAVARDLTNMGRVYHALERYADAQAHYEEALQVSERAAGSSSPDQLVILDQLRQLFDTTQNLRGLVVCLARMAAIEEKRFGKGAPQLAPSIVRLGRALEDRGKTEQAKGCFEEVLRIHHHHRCLSADDEAMVRHRMGRVLSAGGDFAAAIPHFQRALAMHTSVHGQTHSTVARDAFHLGVALIETGDALSGAANLSLALQIYTDTHGHDHRRTREVKDRLDSLQSKK